MSATINDFKRYSRGLGIVREEVGEKRIANRGTSNRAAPTNIEMLRMR